MRLVIKDDFESTTLEAAKVIAEAINTFVPSKEKPFFNIALAAGIVPKGIYQHLVQMFKDGSVDFKNVVTFNLDEYVGVARDHPNSQHSLMWEQFFSHVNVPRENVNFLDGNASDLQVECARYETAISEAGGLDYAFFSTGANGQVARNEPGSSLVSTTRVKTLAEDTIEALSIRWSIAKQEVPKITLTMGLGNIMNAKEVLGIFAGSARSRALEAALELGINHMFPVSAFQRHKKVLFVCDESATLELRVKTVEYFKGLERTKLQWMEKREHSLSMDENEKQQQPPKRSKN
mmetsp:Transcript_15062/g.19537  ORF Transcript_15062/g.19537 Transcript_15062/m.19537 type:complete len:292 (-) Transcript_15062:131-1006(-)